MKRAKVQHLVFAGFFAAMTAVGAFIKIPLYPVPITLQTFVTVLAGLLLTPKWAALSQVVYLTLGLLGAPVFANGGGMEYILRPTFGYLFFMPVAAALVSFLRRGSETFWKSTLSAFAGLLFILIGGCSWLYMNLNYISAIKTPLGAVLISGLVLFIPGAVVKAFAAAVVAGKLGKRI